MLLVRDIAKAAKATKWMSVDSFRSLTHIRGARNLHLAEPDGFDKLCGRYLERRVPLPLDGQVHGEYLTLDYCGHGPWAILEDHDSLEAAEKAILGGAGVLNGFTDFMLAFVNARQRDYEVHEATGRVLVKKAMRVIEPGELRIVNHATCRVVWVGD